MENDMEISSTTENTENFEDEVPYPDQIVIQQICCSDKDSPSLQNDGKDSLLNKMKRPAIDQDTKLLPPKRVRKATRKKLESLISFTEMYECSECPQTFNRLNQFRAHAKSHSSIKNEVYKCESCDEKTNNLRSLIVHRRQHHEEIECSLCHVEFESLNSLKCHMKSHKGEKPYVCKECGASFSQSGHLSIHTRTHTGEKPYTCDICNNNFKQISHLKTHVRTHTHDKPYQCNQCTAAFTQNSSLKRHKRAHTGEKPYKCLECDMTFVVKSNMQRHLNTHTGERPFQCDLCSASFGQAIDLKRHKISHTGIKPYKCDMCEAAFSRKNNLKWHKLTHSENAGYQCSICFAGFSTTGDLKAHMRNHAPPKPFSCDTCPATFRLMESLNRHRMIHTGGRPLRIKSSDKEDVSLKCSKVKPYTCMTCDASFCEKRNLKRHTLSVHQNKDNMINYEILDYESVSNIKVDVGICSPSPENSLNEQDAKEFITENGQTCLHSEVITIPVSNSQHIPVMQNISSHETQMPQFLLAGPGQTARPARPAGQCQNHSLHVLTFIEGSYNHWQSWCFCDPPNIPDSTSQLISSSNEEINEGMTQILITSPIQSNLPENSPQLLMETSSSTSPSNSQHIIINSVCSSDSVMTQSSSPITVDAQSLEIQGNVVSGTNIQFFKEIKAEQQDYT